MASESTKKLELLKMLDGVFRCLDVDGCWLVPLYARIAGKGQKYQSLWNYVLVLVLVLFFFLGKKI